MGSRAWYLRNRDRLRQKREENKDQIREYHKDVRRDQRLRVFQHYSGSEEPRCLGCGEAEFCCLTIDHIADNGAARKKIEGMGSALYRWLIRHKFPTGYQVLCFNCNCGRKRNRLPFPLSK